MRADTTDDLENPVLFDLVPGLPDVLLTNAVVPLSFGEHTCDSHQVDRLPRVPVGLGREGCCERNNVFIQHPVVECVLSSAKDCLERFAS